MPSVVAAHGHSLIAGAGTAFPRPAAAWRGAAAGLPPADRRHHRCGRAVGPAGGHGALCSLIAAEANRSFQLASDTSTSLIKCSGTHDLFALAPACLAREQMDPGQPLTTGLMPCPQWNIERGYQLAAVVAALKAIDADVVALQEVDIGCDRSGDEDTGACCPPHSR